LADPSDCILQKYDLIFVLQKYDLIYDMSHCKQTMSVPYIDDVYANDSMCTANGQCEQSYAVMKDSPPPKTQPPPPPPSPTCTQATMITSATNAATVDRLARRGRDASSMPAVKYGIARWNAFSLWRCSVHEQQVGRTRAGGPQNREGGWVAKQLKGCRSDNLESKTMGHPTE
jgi:hypothetical protein